MKKRIALTILAVLLLPLLNACGPDYDFSGTVAAKEYNEAHQEWVEADSYNDCGYDWVWDWSEGEYQYKNVCTRVIVPAHYEPVPAEWIVVVYVDNDHVRDEYHRVSVSRAAYEACQKGGWFNYEARNCVTR